MAEVKEKQNKALTEQQFLDNTDMLIALKYSYPFKLKGASNPELIPDVPPTDISYLADKFTVAPVSNGVRFLMGTGRELTLPYGVTAIMGKSGTGKTRLAYHTIHRLNSDRGLYLSIDELEGALELIHPNSVAEASETSMVGNLADALFDSKTDYVIVDSLRYLFYDTTGGAAGKGGVNMSLFMKLTRIANVAAKRSKALIFIINPMTDDDAAFSFYKEAAMGAVNAVITLSSPTKAEITSRIAETRQWTDLRVPKTVSNEEILEATIKASKGRQHIGRLLNN